MAYGRTTRRSVCQRVAPSARAPSRTACGTDCSPSSVATTTTGTVSRASVSDAHKMPPVPNVGVGNTSLNSRRSIAPPSVQTKNARPNAPKTIDGTPARLASASRTALVNRLSRAYSLR